MNVPWESAGRLPKPATVDSATTWPEPGSSEVEPGSASHTPTAPSGRRDRLPSGRTNRPRQIWAVGSRYLSSTAVNWSATALDAVGPNDPEPRAWRCLPDSPTAPVSCRAVG